MDERTGIAHLQAALRITAQEPWTGSLSPRRTSFAGPQYSGPQTRQPKNAFYTGRGNKRPALRMARLSVTAEGLVSFPAFLKMRCMNVQVIYAQALRYSFRADFFS